MNVYEKNKKWIIWREGFKHNPLLHRGQKDFNSKIRKNSQENRGRWSGKETRSIKFVNESPWAHKHPSWTSGLFRHIEYVDTFDLILKIQAHASQEGDQTWNP